MLDILTRVLPTLRLLHLNLGTASGARPIGTIAAIAVGFYIVLAGLWAAPISGASMNTTRSFAPAAIGGDLTSFWVYVVGPFLGATIAVGFAYILRRTAPAAGRRAPAWLFAGFLLFRLLDIWKPPPIGWAERSFKGGAGVMLDDVFAGILGGVLIGAALVWAGA